jgi:hypothetical protein
MLLSLSGRLSLLKQKLRHGFHATISTMWLVQVLEGRSSLRSEVYTAEHAYRLIGIMIGRLRMSIDDCIYEYEQLGGKVFGHPRHFHLRSPLFLPRDKYASRRLRNVVSDVVKRRVPKESFFPGGTNLAFDENRCRTYGRHS